MTLENRSINILVLFISLLSWCSLVYSGDINEGKTKSFVCSACHGSNGISPHTDYPNLAGQKEQYLINSLRAYQNKSRNNRLMSPAVESLSNDDIKDLAAYYSNLKP